MKRFDSLDTVEHKNGNYVRYTDACAEISAAQAEAAAANQRADRLAGELATVRDELRGYKESNGQQVTLNVESGQRIRALEEQVHSSEYARKSLSDEVTKLKAFKGFVHKTLDDMGVPAHPRGKHSAEGCRVGDRLDIVRYLLAGKRYPHAGDSADTPPKSARVALLRPPNYGELRTVGEPTSPARIAVWFDSEADARAALIACVEAGTPAKDLALVTEAGRFRVQLEWEAP